MATNSFLVSKEDTLNSSTLNFTSKFNTLQGMAIIFNVAVLVWLPKQMVAHKKFLLTLVLPREIVVLGLNLQLYSVS